MKYYKLYIKLSNRKMLRYFKHDSLTSNNLFSSAELLLKQKRIKQHLSRQIGENVSLIRKEIIFKDEKSNAKRS